MDRPSPDTVIGSGLDDFINGAFGDDVLTGGLGHDQLFGNEGIDKLKAKDGVKDPKDQLRSGAQQARVRQGSTTRTHQPRSC